MPQTDPTDLEKVLGDLRVTPVPHPERMWDAIQGALGEPEATPPLPFHRRRIRSPLLAAAAVVAAVAGGSWFGLLRAYAAPSAWPVVALDGTPRVGGAILDGEGRILTGDVLVTDSFTRARLTVGRLGTVDVGPDSRVRIDRGGFTEHRLSLQRGSISAIIEAPPRLFVVETPVVLATDLGCAYTLDVADDGSSRLRVTAGWVELKGDRKISLVPAGLSAEVQVGGGSEPGTPYGEELDALARAALHRIDAGAPREGDLAAVLDALYTPTHFVTLRKQSAITLWHLLQRVAAAERSVVYERLAGLSPPPARVTREGILALDRRMLERWRVDLHPMWAEDVETWWGRLGRRLVELTLP